MARISSLETLRTNRITRARAYRAAALAELHRNVGVDDASVALSLGLVELWQDSAEDLWLDVAEVAL